MKLKSILYLGVILIATMAQAQTHYQEIIRYKNKNIKTIHTYNSSHVLDGETIHYYPTGFEKTVMNYTNGTVNGLIYNYYNYGTLESFGLVENDLAQGPFEYFHKNGKPKQKIVYYNNLVVAVMDCYSPKGAKLYCGVINSGNGYINIYNSKGVLMAKDIFKEGKIVERQYVD